MKNNFKLFYHILLFALVITSVCSVSFAGKNDLPAPPKGYSWKWCESVQAGFLLPKRWFFKEDENKGTRAIFITKEPLAENNTYKTGFSVNVIKECKDKMGMVPSEYAKQFIDKLKLTTEYSDLDTVEIGTYFKGYNGFFRSEVPGIGKGIQFNLALGNDHTGTFYLFILKSPESEWDAALKIGGPIMDNLTLESEF
ncbi:MAG: hypothetical protein KKD29_07600 [Candidatus Omnitrophica bacterium]|nr:hypothetical protein [Candidatus Omnitrophota bacterium]MBU4488844.1 hypothetical protein [Candidatus Omnitrophota bacterium]MCG2705207.1 hypothetical protein [Candidatus Omnitrophota bacterium]